MNTETWSRFFALLALACLGATVVVWCAAWVARPARRSRQQPWVRWAAEIDVVARDFGLWLAALVAIVTTAGSLYYSLGAGYVPCELCWYQRICMYPLAVLLPIAAWHRDVSVRRYVVPLVVVGGVIAAYHSQLQAFPEQRSFCDPNNPCSSRYVWEFGFISLPLMDLIAFVFIATLVLLGTRRDVVVASDASPSDSPTPKQV